MQDQLKRAAMAVTTELTRGEAASVLAAVAKAYWELLLLSDGFTAAGLSRALHNLEAVIIYMSCLTNTEPHGVEDAQPAFNFGDTTLLAIAGWGHDAPRGEAPR